MVLCDQLDLLGVTLDKISDAVSREDAEALVAHGRFLAEKFGTGSALQPRPRRRRRHPAAGAPVTWPRPRRAGGRGARAGLDEAAVRDEGARLAAAVASPCTGAPAAWLAAVGSPDATYGAFFQAATSARRWRSAPTALLRELVQARSPLAETYAGALAEVISAACDLGPTEIGVVARASATAAVQRAAAAAPPGSRAGERVAPVAPTTPDGAGPEAPGAPTAFPSWTPRPTDPAPDAPPERTLEELLHESE